MTQSDPPASFEGNTPVPSLVDLAAAVRDLTEQILRIPSLPEASAARAAALAKEVRSATRELTAHAPADPVPRMGAEPPTQRPFFVRGVILGEHHPVRPELSFESASGRSWGRARFGVTFEGPPGCVHGGFVAHFFDQVLGQHNLQQQLPAMTGTLSVRYRRATPLFTELTYAVEHEALDERKVRTFGALKHGDEVTAEGEGIFIIPQGVDWHPGNPRIA